MSRSVLLQLARDSIQEVIEAKRTIDAQELLQVHPLLKEKVNVRVNLYLENKLRGSHMIDKNDVKLRDANLLDAIIHSAKKAAFEDPNFSPITTSEYLSCEIELILDTPDGTISQKDPSILKTTKFKIQNVVYEEH